MFSWELKIHRVLVLPVVWALIVAAYSSVQLLSLCASWEELREQRREDHVIPSTVVAFVLSPCQGTLAQPMYLEMLGASLHATSMDFVPHPFFHLVNS